MFSQSELDFIQVEPSLLFKIVLAADFLDMPDLLELGCLAIGNLIKGKTRREMKKALVVVAKVPNTLAGR